ncbi:MAG TPA: hypothetical protein VL381_03010 [Rhodocyclaceae bacterium]|nr:hypothetical protein [Rhodocyclaceae bacterium]
MTRTIPLFKWHPLSRVSYGKFESPAEVLLLAELSHGAKLPADRWQRFQKVGVATTRTDQGTDHEGAALLMALRTAGADAFMLTSESRVLMAVSGSLGTQLRFCTASAEELAREPGRFLQMMQCVNIPANCLFTLRLSREVWHQFAPAVPGGHPSDVLRVLSCHENGHRVQAAAVPPARLPVPVIEAVDRVVPETVSIPVTALSLLPAPMRGRTPQQQFFLQRARRLPVYGQATTREVARVKLVNTARLGSLIQGQLGNKYNFADSYEVTLDNLNLANLTPELLLEGLLEGFINRQPFGVRCLMAVRNLALRMLGVIAPSLGCPIVALMSPESEMQFAMRFPVRGDRIEAHRAQVVIGTDAPHIMLRTCIGVEIIGHHKVRFSLDFRGRCCNAIGHGYTRMTGLLYQRYITPTILQYGVDYLCENTAVAQTSVVDEQADMVAADTRLV